VKKILFVCLGNICRSPAADGIMNHLVKMNGQAESYFIDSAGTSAHHVGERADSRMRKHAARRGYELESISRQFVSSDFEEFDLILAMDKSNLSNILRLDTEGKYQGKVKLFCDFCQKHKISEVPDPYYGGNQGFEDVLDIVEDGVAGILAQHG
jgi:protein-tyrosine phosphatase